MSDGIFFGASAGGFGRPEIVSFDTMQMKNTACPRCLLPVYVLRYLTTLFFFGLLAACSSSGRVVDHAFSFDIRRAIPAVDVIDYRYGTSGLPGARAVKWAIDEGIPSNPLCQDRCRVSLNMFNPPGAEQKARSEALFGRT
jgi:hypothetical protein